jgi:hypothetical protein
MARWPGIIPVAGTAADLLIAVSWFITRPAKSAELSTAVPTGGGEEPPARPWITSATVSAAPESSLSTPALFLHPPPPPSAAQGVAPFSIYSASRMDDANTPQR